MTDSGTPQSAEQKDFYEHDDELGRRLRTLFDDVVSEPVPKHLNDLLDSLDGGQTRR